MGSLTELQTIRRTLECSLQEALDKIEELQKIVKDKDDVIQELTSKLDKYQSIVHSPTIANRGQAPRKQRTTGISAEPGAGYNLKDIDKVEPFKTYPKSTG